MNECKEILEAARKHGIPASALCALRIVENGREGREFGVLSQPAPTYAAQADIAALSFKNAEARYHLATGLRPYDYHGRYTTEFLRHFSARWAPVGAANDPHDLNAHHAHNLIKAYYFFD